MLPQHPDPLGIKAIELEETIIMKHRSLKYYQEEMVRFDNEWKKAVADGNDLQAEYWKKQFDMMFEITQKLADEILSAQASYTEICDVLRRRGQIP